MKLLHLADLHLGRSLGEFDLYKDQKYILDQILSIVDREAVDGLLIAGDVYDKAIPSEAATRLLDYFLCALAERKVGTFIISGNHDSDERLHYGSSLFERNQIFISSLFDGSLTMRTMEDSHGEVCIWLLPFVKASQVRHFFPEEKIENYEDAVRVILNHAPIDKTRRNVLLAHQFVTGHGQDPVAGGSEKSVLQSVGLVEKIGADCFDAFDYVALGHIHSPQKVGREEVRYAGSILKYSSSEASGSKSVPLICLGEKGDLSLDLIPLKPMRDLRHIKGSLAVLLSPEHVSDPEDFIHVTLTDENPVDDAMGIIRRVYPNTIRIDYDNAHSREVGQIDLTRPVEDRTFPELIEDFYRQMYQCPISDKEMEIMMQAAKEAGIIHETD